MNTEKPNVGLAVLVTAVLVGGGVYYFSAGPKNLDSDTTNQANSTLSQTSKEYAVMGRQLWSAFQCASWASVVGDNKEQERLFLFGYAQGEKFLVAAKAGKIENPDINQEVPIGVTMLVQGPTNDFILGRIFEGAQEEALDEVYKTGNKYNSTELQKIIAENKYRDSNCQLIGK
ncbi:MAG: hypothetical protein G01um101449_299 [Parcubacteria group bacterium Gr01-1014_49]|nr:MAG: hypothetical protein G01um101449_299 [Parcubacteria group bacterium Gr01-1014_49]